MQGEQQSILDCAPLSQVRVLDHVDGPRAWTRTSVDPSHWRVELSGAAVREVLEMVRAMREAPLPLLLRHPDAFALTACRELMAEVKARLLDGIGLAVVHALPIDDMTASEATAVYWILGQFLATPVATKWDGTMLYDVTDTGKAFGYGVRGSATNVELAFHTDNAFGVVMPDYVGLLCIRPAMTGGISRFCSLYSVHNEMQRHPRLLRRLYEPMVYDRQAEHAPTAPKVMRTPMLRVENGQLSARLTPNLVRRAYDMLGEPMDETLVEALQCLDATLARPELSIEFQILRGELQYVQNHWCAHYRSAFVDSDDPACKRHLVRVWYREQGARTYDG